MKKIKIFLGSSIVEFKNERQELENFIHNLSNEFIEKYEVMVIPFTCESYDNAMAKTRKQDEYNKQIAESDMCFFLFFTRAGEYTVEELNYAYNIFKNNEKGKPKIYVYFKEFSGRVESDESINHLKQILDKNYGHFFSSFETIDTIKLRVLLNLKFQEMNFLPVNYDGNRLILNGNPVPGVAISNVDEFVKNGCLKELEKQLLGVEEQYYQLLPVYRAGNCSDDVYKKFSDISGKRFLLKEQIEDLQKQIFELSLRLCQDNVKGDMTPRMKEAYRLLELGDMEGCVSVLDQNDIDSDFERWERKQEEEGKRKASIYIREHSLAIDVLMTMYSYANRNEEIISRFEKIVAVAKKYKVELQVVLDYSVYLFNHQNSQKALQELDSLLSMNGLSEEIKGKALDKAALISGDLDYSETCLRRALDIWAKLGEDYNYNYISTYSCFANLLFKKGLSDEALEMMKKNIVAISQLVINGDNNLLSLIHFVNVMHELASMYAERDKNDKAEELFNKEITLVERLYDFSCSTYYFFLAHSYEGLAKLYSNDLTKAEESEELYKKAILALKNETNIENDDNQYLANLLIDLALLHSRMHKLEEAEKDYKDSLEILSQLCDDDPQCYEPKLATAFYQLSGFYLENYNLDKAEQYCVSALNICKRISDFNFEDNSWISILVLTRFAEIDIANGNTDDAEKKLQNATEIIIQLEKTTNEYDLYHPLLIQTYNRLSELYYLTNQNEKAELIKEKISHKRSDYNNR